VVTSLGISSKLLYGCTPVQSRMYDNFRCDITGTGNSSVSQNLLVIEVCYKEVDMEASSLCIHYRYDMIQKLLWQ